MKHTRPCLCDYKCDMTRPEFQITFRDQGIFRGAPAILCGFLLYGRPFLVASRNTARRTVCIRNPAQGNGRNQSDPNILATKHEDPPRSTMYDQRAIPTAHTDMIWGSIDKQTSAPENHVVANTE